jgi:hypothetical protein
LSKLGKVENAALAAGERRTVDRRKIDAAMKHAGLIN